MPSGGDEKEDKKKSVHNFSIKPPGKIKRERERVHYVSYEERGRHLSTKTRILLSKRKNDADCRSEYNYVKLRFIYFFLRRLTHMSITTDISIIHYDKYVFVLFDTHTGTNHEHATTLHRTLNLHASATIST